MRFMHFNCDHIKDTQSCVGYMAGAGVGGGGGGNRFIIQYHLEVRH